MKMYFLFILFPLFLSPPESAVDWQLDTTQDLGLLKRDQPQSVTFSFKNVSTEPMTIDNIRVTCGCTAPKWDLIPTMPGEIGSFDITYDAKKEGYFYKKIKVYFSAQRRAEVIYIEGEVE